MNLPSPLLNIIYQYISYKQPYINELTRSINGLVAKNPRQRKNYQYLRIAKVNKKEWVLFDRFGKIRFDGLD